VRAPPPRGPLFPGAVTGTRRSAAGRDTVPVVDIPAAGSPVGAGDRPSAEALLARATMQALRVGVLLLDADDRPVLANPATWEMGLVRARADGGAEAHTIE